MQVQDLWLILLRKSFEPNYYGCLLKILWFQKLGRSTSLFQFENESICFCRIIIFSFHFVSIYFSSNQNQLYVYGRKKEQGEENTWKKISLTFNESCFACSLLKLCMWLSSINDKHWKLFALICELECWSFWIKTFFKHTALESCTFHFVQANHLEPFCIRRCSLRCKFFF